MGTIVGDDERLELAQWIFSRQESLRTSSAQRASTIITACAFVIAVYGLLLRQVPVPQGSRLGNFFLFSLPLCVGMLLTISAIIFAIVGFLHVGRRSRAFLDNGTPGRLHFHSEETVAHFKSFEEFRGHFITTDSVGLRDALLATLWSTHRQHALRYNILRRAAQLLIVALLVLAYEVAILAFASL